MSNPLEGPRRPTCPSTRLHVRDTLMTPMNSDPLEVLRRLFNTYLTLSNDSATEASRLLVEQNYATEASARIEVEKVYKRAWEIINNTPDQETES